MRASTVLLPAWIGALLVPGLALATTPRGHVDGEIRNRRGHLIRRADGDPGWSGRV